MEYFSEGIKNKGNLQYLEINFWDNNLGKNSNNIKYLVKYFKNMKKL